MKNFLFLFLFLFLFISVFDLVLSQDDCLPLSCTPSSPVIRFPFWIKGLQPERCGYKGFGISCNENGRADLDFQFPLTASSNNINLPFNVTVTVWEIDYEAQKMLVGYARARSCLPEKLPSLNSSPTSPFEVEALGYGGGSTLFNCSNTRGRDTVSCLSNRRYQVVEIGSMNEINSLIPYSSCFKMYNVSYVPDGALTGTGYEYSTQFYLNWSRPSCGKCEEEGGFCRLKLNAEAGETECFSTRQNEGGESKNTKSLTAGIVTAGVILLAFIVIALFFIFKAMKRRKHENRKIENAIKKHNDMKATRYTHAEVKRITNNFREKLTNSSLHKGKLGDGKPVAVKLLDPSQQNVEDFIDEVEIIGRIQHANILHLVGYCAQVGKRALVYEYLQGETLEALIVSSRNQKQTLDREKLHKIAGGVANGIECAHRESTKKILNLFLNPRDILLDQSFNPKIVVATTSEDEGGSGYTAPEVFSSSLSIIPERAYAYGFGMVLMDMVGRSVDSFSSGEEREEGAIQIEEEEEEEEEEEDLCKKLLIVGLWCMQWFPSDRPSMKAVIEMLQEENMPSIPPNPFLLDTEK